MKLRERPVRYRPTARAGTAGYSPFTLAGSGLPVQQKGESMPDSFDDPLGKLPQACWQFLESVRHTPDASAMGFPRANPDVVILCESLGLIESTPPDRLSFFGYDLTWKGRTWLAGHRLTEKHASTPPTPLTDSPDTAGDSTPPAAKPGNGFPFTKGRNLHADPPDTIQELVFIWLRTAEHRKDETPWVADAIREAIRKAPGGPKIENACIVRFGEFTFTTAQQLLAEVASDRGQTFADYLPLPISTIAGYLPDSPPAVKQEQGEGNGRAGKMPGQSEVASGAARKAVFRQLSPAVQKAYLAYEYAESMNRLALQDRDAYAWLCENGFDQGQGDRGELTDYELPSFDTWGRQLRDARHALGEQKHTRRAGRAAGSSIVRGDEK